MSEKRFVLEISSFSGKHMKFLNILDNGKRLKSEDIVDLLNEQQATIQSLKEENRKLRNIHLSIGLTYSYGYGRYLADVRVIDDE